MMRSALPYQTVFLFDKKQISCYTIDIKKHLTAKDLLPLCRYTFDREEEAGDTLVGVIDTEGKKYLSINRFFADMFNFLLYDGKPVIQPEELRELDTTEIAIPYGNGARVPVQKYRDLLKLWSAYMDDTAVFLNRVAKLDLEFDEKENQIDMCLQSLHQSRCKSQVFRKVGLTAMSIHLCKKSSRGVALLDRGYG